MVGTRNSMAKCGRAGAIAKVEEMEVDTSMEANHKRMEHEARPFFLPSGFFLLFPILPSFARTTTNHY